MRKTVSNVFVCLLLAVSLCAAEDVVEVGKKAPDFSLQDSKGQTIKLSDFQGKEAVVLEFFRSGDW